MMEFSTTVYVGVFINIVFLWIGYVRLSKAAITTRDGVIEIGKGVLANKKQIEKHNAAMLDLMAVCGKTHERLEDVIRHLQLTDEDLE